MDFAPPPAAELVSARSQARHPKLSNPFLKPRLRKLQWQKIRAKVEALSKKWAAPDVGESTIGKIVSTAYSVSAKAVKNHHLYGKISPERLALLSLAIVRTESTFNPNRESGQFKGLMAVGFTIHGPELAEQHITTPRKLKNIKNNLGFGIELLASEIEKHGILKGVEAYNGGSRRHAYARKVIQYFNEYLKELEKGEDVKANPAKQKEA